jgi:RNA polymerase sigma-70 factor (ECF subfamily)
MAHGRVLGRIARAYELDPDKRRDLLQEMHLALWKSFETFEGRCSLLTWVHRVAHFTGTNHVIRQQRARLNKLLTIEEVEHLPDKADRWEQTDRLMAVERLLGFIHRLRPLDRQIMLLYLEDMDSAAIAEITGLSPGHVRTQIHRIKIILARRFKGGDQYAE